MTVAKLYELIKVQFPDVTESHFLVLLNQVMRIVAEDTKYFKELDTITTDGESAYDLDTELDYEPLKIKLLQLAGTTIEAVQASLLEDVDI